jgi:eukaryotic-like serine/threonine-protein kinase
MTAQDLQSALPGRYRVVREIGRGGMATVYLADDNETGRQVAIKVLTGELGSSLNATRFTREIKIAGELTHPNILQAFDSGAGQGLVYYVMPFVAGKSIRARIDEDGPLAVEDAVRITCEVCDALAYAHARGIVHRDIKPENILLENGHAVVADFGIARVIAEQGATLTQTGLSLGTAQYMSPEQASAEKVDARSDVYSVGCVLYEMLVGEPPFTGPNAMAVMARAVTQPVPSVRVVRPSVPELVEFAIMHALEKVPADRFASASEFKDALLAADDSPLATKQRKAYTAAYRTGGAQAVPPSVWRGPRALGAMGVLAVIVLGGGGWLMVHGRRGAGAAPVDSDTRNVAVMYFDDKTPDGSLRYMADGITEGLIDELRLVPTLNVLSRSAVRPFRGAEFSSKGVYAALNAGTIVRGEIAGGDARPKVTVRVVDAVSGSELKNATFTFDTANALAARDSLTKRVADFLRTEVGLSVTLKESRLRAKSPQAWTLWQRAKSQLRDADSLLTARAAPPALPLLATADRELIDAAKRDPEWPDPLITRAAVARSRARAMRENPAAANVSLDSARVFIDQALRLDPQSADAHEMSGDIAFEHIVLNSVPQGKEYDRELDISDRELREAVRLNPQQATAYEMLSNVSYAKKDVPDGLQAARDAYNADAYLLNARGILGRLFFGFFDTENFPEARKYCDEGHRRFPKAILFVQCDLYLMMTKGGTPDPARAWKLVDTIRALATPTTLPYEDHMARTFVGGVLGKAGLRDSANRVLIAARADRDVDPAQEIIGREIGMRLMYGDFDTAIERLRDYLLIHPDHRKGLANQTAWYWRDPRVQNDPRFKKLIAGAG